MKPPYHIRGRLHRHGACSVLRRANRRYAKILFPRPARRRPPPSPAERHQVSVKANISLAPTSDAALILVANENTGLGGSVREYAESANGNVAPSTVISHINGPFAIAFSSTEGIGIANGHIDVGRPGRDPNVRA